MFNPGLLLMAAGFMAWAMSIVISMTMNPPEKFFWDGFITTAITITFIMLAFVLAALALP